MGQDDISAAIDHFGDVVRFLKEARLESEKGQVEAVARFIKLAFEASCNGDNSIRQALPDPVANCWPTR